MENASVVAWKIQEDKGIKWYDIYGPSWMHPDMASDPEGYVAAFKKFGAPTKAIYKGHLMLIQKEMDMSKDYPFFDIDQKKLPPDTLVVYKQLRKQIDDWHLQLLGKMENSVFYPVLFNLPVKYDWMKEYVGQAITTIGLVDRLQEYVSEGGCTKGLDEIAAENGHLQALKYLRTRDDAEPLTDEEKINTLRAACRGGHLKILKYLHSIGIIAKEDYFMTDAAYSGNLSCVKYLHKNGLELNYRIVNTACEQGHVDILKYAIENGCRCNLKYCLDLAIQYQHPELESYIRDRLNRVAPDALVPVQVSEEAAEKVVPSPIWRMVTFYLRY